VVRLGSLKDANSRLARANHHLDEVKREIDGLARAVIASGDTNLSVTPTGSGEITDITNTEVLDSIDADAPARFGILVGETIYNLRAALDYLVYQLAISDSGMIQKGTQFPDRSDGVCPRHKAVLRGYERRVCAWYERLAEISNQDKHRYIELAYGAEGLRLIVSGFSASGEPSIASASVDVTLRDGDLVVDLLEQLQHEVASVLGTFQQCFAGHCSH
jgi:hypothetical protein